ncbi:MAG: Long-chain-fatty-acid--CoA ligase [Deltaproteobacteria bacterium ADurb.Bin510]|nr:MAG: Long-chain-fatty-acid--CoA ligase [Deltaproteobacteria bacterium ADurb.Bin510]
MPYLATLVGARQIYPGRHNPHTALELIRDQKVTFSHCLPTMLHMIMSDPLVDEVDLSRLKLIVSGAKISRQLAQDAMGKGLNIYSGYGMSEACPLISVSHLKPDKGHSTKDRLDAVTSAGIPAPLVELRIVDHLGTPLPHDGSSVGEIVVRSPWLTRGYYNDADRGHNLWRDGWLHTGDIGFIDTDGYIHITERTKDVIKSGGEWISGAQLENMVRKHKAVADAAVVGVPDEKWGEKPLVLVVIKDELKDLVSEDDLKNFMQYFVDSGEVSKYALPDKYLIVDEIPTTGVRKVNFRMIRENLGVE